MGKAGIVLLTVYKFNMYALADESSNTRMSKSHSMQIK